MSFLGPVTRLTELSLRRWRTFLAAALVLGAAGIWLASHLEIRSSFEELLPEDVPSVRHAKELARRVGGDGTVLLMVEAKNGPQDLQKAERLAVKLAEAFRELGPEVIRAVESDIGPVRRWYTGHWPMFLPLGDLRGARDELVKAIGAGKAKANPLLGFLGEGEGDAPPESSPAGPLDLAAHPKLAELLDPAKPSPRQKVEEGFVRYVDGFMVHPDRRSVTVVIRPTGTSLGVGEVRVILDKMQAVADRFAGEARAEGLAIGFGGSYPVLLAEYRSIIEDALTSFLVVLVLLFFSLWAFFRELRLVVALGGAVAVAVAVTFGLAWLGIGYLNTQTAFLGSIVAGNGINYGIVYLGRVGQLRRQGFALDHACREAAQVAARGTLLAALGTSVSFGTLLVATNRGFRHFGFIGGVGMVLCWAATFALLPALLTLQERLRPRLHPARPLTHERAVAVLERWMRWPKLTVALFAVLTAVAAAIFLRQLPTALERNLDNLTNDQTGSDELRRVNARAQGGLGQSISGSIALLPSREAAEGYCDALEARMRAEPRLRELIHGCETVGSVVPVHQEEKLALLREIAGRLTPRVLSKLPAPQAERARAIRADLAAQGPLGDADAPASLLDRFRERDGTVGRIAFVRSQPNAKLELAQNLRAFAAAVRQVPVGDGRYDAAGVDIVVADLLADIERQGPRVTLLSFLCVCGLVVIFFRRPGRSALLIASLTSGVVLMAGIAALAGIKINFFNFIVYPITFGIAVDYGANVLSRMGSRRTIVPALVEVGTAVAFCSWTTIVGYGSLILSFNRALRSFGWYAMLGEVTTLATALVFLPAMVMLVPRRVWAGREPAGAPGGVRAGGAAVSETSHVD